MIISRAVVSQHVNRHRCSQECAGMEESLHASVSASQCTVKSQS